MTSHSDIPVERGMLFSAPMVRAILDGRKTMTRRVMKQQPACIRDPYGLRGPIVKGSCYSVAVRFASKEQFWACPYGQPGDRLWVRETGWERPARTPKMMREGADTWERYYYDADGLSEGDHEQFKKWGFKRRPSIHMPRWASRITLEITAVRVERLQDISEQDAIAEGIEFQDGDNEISRGYLSHDRSVLYDTAREAFKNLWESINGPGSWAQNPWVWVIEYRRV